MIVEGQLHLKLATQQISDKFSKREFILKTELSSQYPQLVKFELTQDNCSLLDKVSEGDILSVDFNLRGREYKNKNTAEVGYFNTLVAWKIDRKSAGAPVPTNAGSVPAPPAQSKTDDLPF